MAYIQKTLNLHRSLNDKTIFKLHTLKCYHILIVWYEIQQIMYLAHWIQQQTLKLLTNQSLISSNFLTNLMLSYNQAGCFRPKTKMDRQNGPLVEVVEKLGFRNRLLDLLIQKAESENQWKNQICKRKTKRICNGCTTGTIDYSAWVTQWALNPHKMSLWGCRSTYKSFTVIQMYFHALFFM